MFRLRVLGGLELERDGVPVPVGTPRARALLAWLALHPGMHPRSLVAGRMRPDVPEDAARKGLRQAVWALGREAGDGLLAATRDEVGLAGGAVVVDLAEFRRLRGEGRGEEALALCRGDLLAGLDAPWADEARRAHRADVGLLLADMAARAAADGDGPQALALAGRRAALDPLAEAPQRDLMRRLAEAGDAGAALGAYDRLAARMRDELRMAPSAETRRLADDIRRGVVARGPATGTPPPLPLPLRREGPLVGRADALRAVEAAWGAAGAGAPALVLVSGEPGIGKTRLAAEAARRAHARGVHVLYGRADEDPLVPHQPVVEALTRHVDGLDPVDRLALAGRQPHLARLLPALGEPPPASGDPGADRFRAYEAVRALLEDLAAARPLMVVLDDLHWADEPTLALLRHLARMAPDGQVLLLVAYRDTEAGGPLPAALAGLRRERDAVRVPLAGLGAGDVAELTGPGDRHLADRVLARTAGNPLFVEELLRDLREGGAGAAGALPPGVKEVIGHRVDRLGPRAAAVLRLVAVLGPDADAALVEALAPAGGPLAGVPGLGAGDVLDALDRAAAARLLAPGGDGRLAFSHALVAEALLDDLAPVRRRRLHAAAALALEARPGREAAVARHLAAAGPDADPERVERWCLLAARRAAAMVAYEDAAAHLSAAAAAAPPARRPALLVELGEARVRAGRPGPALDALREAADAAAAAGDGALLARAALAARGVGVSLGAADPHVVALLDRALAVAGPGAVRARLLARLALELHYDDRPRAEATAAAAVAEARASGDAAALAAALGARHVSVWDPDHADERLAVADEMAALADRAGDEAAALQARDWRVLDLMELGRIDDAEREVAAYAALAGPRALPQHGWYVPLWRAALAMLRGRWDEAAALTAQAAALGERAGDPNAPVFELVQRESALCDRRRFDLVDVERVAAAAALSPARAAWLPWLVTIHAERGERDAAERIWREAARDGFAGLPRDLNWHVACEAAEACAVLGDASAVPALRAVLAPHARLFPAVARAIYCYGSAHYFLGRLAATAGDAGGADAHFAAAARENARVGAMPRLALTHLRHAQAWRAAGDAGRAAVPAALAADAARRAGMPEVAAEAARLVPAPA